MNPSKAPFGTWIVEALFDYATFRHAGSDYVLASSVTFNGDFPVCPAISQFLLAGVLILALGVHLSLYITRELLRSDLVLLC